MVFLLIITCLFFLIVGMRCSNNNLFSPSVMTSSIWLVSFLLYLTLGQQLPDLSLRFYLCVLLWIAGLCFSSLFVQSATFRNSRLDEPGLLMRNIYLLLSVLALPKLYFFTKQALEGGVGGNWAWSLRLAALGQGSGFDEPFTGLFAVIWQVSLLLELLCFEKKKWWRLALISAIYLAFGVATMSKIIFLCYFLFMGTIFYFKKILTLKHLLICLSLLVVLFIGVQTARNAMKFSSTDHNFFLCYVVSNFYAFDTLEPMTASHWGENTFRVFYAIAEKMEWSKIEPVDPLLEWIQKPIPTNTYTTLYPFYVDFGAWGIGFFSIFLGSLYGWLFKKAQSGSNFHLLFYAVLTNALFMQYAAELFFSTFAGYVKLFVLLLIPFLATKHNLLALKRKITEH